jgi:hypothetical protein
VQPADYVKFRNSKVQRPLRLLHDFLHRELKSVRVSLLPGKGAELAAQDAVVRVVDIAIDDEAGAIARLSLPGKVRDGAQRVEVLALEEPQRLGIGYPLSVGDFPMDVAQFAVLNKKVH